MNSQTANLIPAIIPLKPAPMMTTLKGLSSSMHELLRLKLDLEALMLCGSPASMMLSALSIGEKEPALLSRLNGEMGLRGLSGLEVLSLGFPLLSIPGGRMIGSPRICWIPGDMAEVKALASIASIANVLREYIEPNRADTTRITRARGHIAAGYRGEVWIKRLLTDISFTQ